MDGDANSKGGNMTRRGVIGAAAGAAAGAAVVAPALAQSTANCRIGPAPHPKGPLVFLDYDQIELDAAYDQSSYAPLGAQIQARRATNSEEVRRRLGEPQ